MKFTEEIPTAMAGERLDRAVSMISDVSRSVASDLVSTGAVSLNSQIITKPSHRLDAGVVVEFSYVAPPSELEPDTSVSVNVVWHDEHMAVIDKAPGQVVHPGAGNKSGTLVNGLLAKFPQIEGVGEPDRPGIVHRLDKDTSGLMLVALDAQAHEALTDQLRARLVERNYLALVEGQLAAAAGTIDAPLGRSQNDPTRRAVIAGGKHAITHYGLVDKFEGCALVNCRLETGRTHQIRVHMASINNPVVGDIKYGAKADSGLARFFLHSHKLALSHPITEEYLTFSSELSPDLASHLKLQTPSG